MIVEVEENPLFRWLQSSNRTAFVFKQTMFLMQDFTVESICSRRQIAAYTNRYEFQITPTVQ